MKKLTALLLAIVLAFSLCTVASMADDESVAIVLVPEDETLLTAEDLALFFVDRDAIEEETETSVSWYKETTKDGKAERELVEEMPLIIKMTAVGPRIYAADGYIPSLKLVDLVAAYAPEKDPDSEHVYCWHRIFNQDCRWRGLRYGTCKDCYGIEFDLARGNHSYKDGACTVCGKMDPDAIPTPTATPAPTTAPTATPAPTTAPTADPSSEPTADPSSEPTADPSSEPTADPTVAPTEDPCEHVFGDYIDNSDNHYRKCSKCGSEEISNHDEDEALTYDKINHRYYCQTCNHTFLEGEHVLGEDEIERVDKDGLTHKYKKCIYCPFETTNYPS